MRYIELVEYWRSDLRKYLNKDDSGLLQSLKVFTFRPGFKYTFYLRLCQYLASKGKLFLPVYGLSRWVLLHYQYKFGIQIYPSTKIGYGLCIHHFNCIVVNGEAIIGDNCQIRHGVTIGSVDGSASPVLGDNVNIGAGAKVIGGIRIGSNVTIGANAVVTKDVPDNVVVAGIPAVIISSRDHLA